MTHHSPGGAWLPLTLAQLDFWEEFRFHPDTAVSTVAHAIELQGVGDGAALARAINATIAETDIMALRFGLDPSGQPQQRIDPARRPILRQIDLSTEADGCTQAFTLMQADVDAALDLLAQPLTAQWLIRLAAGHYLWFNRGHHIALDGFGMGLIERRCAQIHAALTQGAAPGPTLAPLAAYLAEETDYRASPRHACDASHWAGVLACAPRPQVLRKGSESYPTAAHCAEHDLAALRPALLAQARATGMGWPDLLTALCGIWTAVNITDGSASREQDAQGNVRSLVWLPYMSRMGSVSIQIPALVVNILPFDLCLHPAEALQPVLARLGARLRQLRRHGRHRIEQIATDHGLEPRSRFFFSPLINVLPFDEARFAGCATHRHVLSNGPGDGFNITLRADTEGHGLELCLEADPDLTPPAEFARLAADLPRFLAAALDPGALPLPLSALA